MARFERSKGRKKDYRNSSKKRSSRFKDSEDNPRGRKSFGDSFRGKRSSRDSPRGRKFSRESRDSGRGRDVERTTVTCSSCGDKCEVPFKPTSGKPVYCSNCFAKQERDGPDRHSNNHSNRDLNIINKKLDKIMEALDIE